MQLHVIVYNLCYMLFKYMVQHTYRILNIWVAMVIFEYHFHYIEVAMLRSIVQWCLAQLQTVRRCAYVRNERNDLSMEGQGVI